MNTWTIQLTITTTHHVDTDTAASLLSTVTACHQAFRSHGTPGVSVLLDVDAATATGAYGAALAILVTEVLPQLEGPVLTDMLISSEKPPPVERDHPTTEQQPRLTGTHKAA